VDHGVAVRLPQQPQGDGASLRHRAGVAHVAPPLHRGWRMEVAWTMVWLCDFLCSPKEMDCLSATTLGLPTSLCHYVGAGDAMTPSSVTLFSFFFVFFNL
jgi:hypothetical protein